MTLTSFLIWTVHFGLNGHRLTFKEQACPLLLPYWRMHWPFDS